MTHMRAGHGRSRLEISTTMPSPFAIRTALVISILLASLVVSACGIVDRRAPDSEVESSAVSATAALEEALVGLGMERGETVLLTSEECRVGTISAWGTGSVVGYRFVYGSVWRSPMPIDVQVALGEVESALARHGFSQDAFNLAAAGLGERYPTAVESLVDDFDLLKITELDYGTQSEVLERTDGTSYIGFKDNPNEYIGGNIYAEVIVYEEADIAKVLVATQCDRLR
jgi:hypothetical protein